VQFSGKDMPIYEFKECRTSKLAKKPITLLDWVLRRGKQIKRRGIERNLWCGGDNKKITSYGLSRINTQPEHTDTMLRQSVNIRSQRKWLLNCMYCSCSFPSRWTLRANDSKTRSDQQRVWAMSAATVSDGVEYQLVAAVHRSRLVHHQKRLPWYHRPSVLSAKHATNMTSIYALWSQ